MCLTFHVALGLHVPELSLASVYAFMVGTTAHRALTRAPASRLSQFGSFAARSGGLAMTTYRQEEYEAVIEMEEPERTREVKDALVKIALAWFDWPFKLFKN